MEETINIKDLIRLILSKIWLIIIITILGGAAAFGISKTLLPLEYSSHITMYVQSYYGNSEDMESQSNISNSKQLVNTYMEVLKDDAVMNAVGDMLLEQYERSALEKCFSFSNNKISTSSLRSTLAISSVTDTSAVNVVSTTKNADIAAAICNNLTKIAPEYVNEAVGVGSINTIDKAKVYPTPVSPNVVKNTLLGAIAGMILTILIVFLVDFFDNTIKASDYINEKYQKAILGEIEQFGSDKKKKKSKKNKGDDDDYLTLLSKDIPFNVAESYKSIRTNISFALSTTEKKIFAVTSANPNEGKSTTSANAAIAIAQSGKKVLLIDADMRKSRQHKIFGLKNKKGLSTAVSKMDKLEDCIQKTTVKDLNVMTAGPTPPNPSELIASQNMDELIGKLNEMYDVIILDTAPINIVSDALELTKNISGVVIVIRYASTTNDDVETAVKKVEFANLNIMGFILNGITVKHSGRYYKKDYYNKGYGYYSNTAEKADSSADEKKDDKKADDKKNGNKSKK